MTEGSGQSGDHSEAPFPHRLRTRVHLTYTAAIRTPQPFSWNCLLSDTLRESTPTPAHSSQNLGRGQGGFNPWGPTESASCGSVGRQQACPLLLLPTGPSNSSTQAFFLPLSHRPSKASSHSHLQPGILPTSQGFQPSPSHRALQRALSP